MKPRPRLPLCLSLILLALAGVAPAVAAQTTVAPPANDPRLELPDTDDGLPGSGPIRRHDWFRNRWREYRNKWTQRVAQDQGAVVFYGDSITDGWNDDFAGLFPGLKKANRGISGDTTRGLLLRVSDVTALHPRAVVLLIGTNDLEEQATPETVAGNLKLLLATLQRSDPRLPIIVCQVFPSSPEKKRPPEKIKRLNELYLEAVKGNPQITFLETWPLFANAEGNAKPEEFPDLLHPNEIGYAKWAAALRPVFATLGLIENEPDTFSPEPGFVSLFNGRDLTGWGYRPTSEADRTSAKRWQASDPTGAAAWPFVDEAVSFDGLTASPDGRYVARNGRLIVTTPPEYRKIQQLWTTREFGENFVLKLEFRATPNADSGVYVRGPQLQCRDYLLAGPYKQLRNYRPQDWNEIIVTVKDGVAHATCNGEVLEAEMKLPASGPIGVEGDRGQMEYRRIRVQLAP